MKTVKVADLEGFENSVFGADCFLEWWPEILTTGIQVELRDDLYYIVHPNASDSSFFTEEEMEFLEDV